MQYQPLTKEQFQKARSSGFTPEKIIEMEQKRKAESVPVQQVSQKDQTWAGGVIRDMTKNVIGKPLASMNSLGAAIQGGDINAPMKTKYWGDVNRIGSGFDATKGLTKENISAVKDSVGTGLEMASFIPGVKGAYTVGKGFVKPTLQKMYQTGLKTGKEGLQQGLLYSTGDQLAETGTIDPWQTAKDTALSGVAGFAGGAILAPTIGQKALSRNTGKAGFALEKSGKAAERADKKEWLKKLLKDTKKSEKAKADAANRSTVEGSTIVRGLKPFSRRSLNTLLNIDELKPGSFFGASTQKAFNVIKDQIIKTANELTEHLKLDKTPFKDIVKGGDNAFLNKFEQIKNKILNSPLSKGATPKNIIKVINEAKRIFKNSKKTRLGQLKARQDFDKYWRRQGGKFTNETGAPDMTMDELVKSIRKQFNDVVTNNGKDKIANKALSKQTDLYTAKGIVGPKAGGEKEKITGRIWQKLKDIVNLRNTTTQVGGVAFGLGGLGMAATFAPVFTGLLLTLGTGALTYRAIRNPQVRKALGKALQEVSGFISKSEKNALIRDLQKVGFTEEELAPLTQIPRFSTKPTIPVAPKGSAIESVNAIPVAGSYTAPKAPKGGNRIRNKKIRDIFENEVYTPESEMPTIGTGRIPRKIDNTPVAPDAPPNVFQRPSSYEPYIPEKDLPVIDAGSVPRRRSSEPIAPDEAPKVFKPSPTQQGKIKQISNEFQKTGNVKKTIKSLKEIFKDVKKVEIENMVDDARAIIENNGKLGKFFEKRIKSLKDLYK